MTADRLDRRTVLTRTATGAAAACVAGGLGWWATRRNGTSAASAVEEFVSEPLFDRSRRIAVAPDGRIVVAADRSIGVLQPDGRHVGSYHFGRPVRSVAFAADGSFFVGCLDEVFRYDTLEGTYGDEFASFDRGTVVAGLTVDGDRLYVADAGLGIVHVLDSEGREVTRIESTADRFHAPAEFFAIDAADGLVHVANPGRHRIETFDRDGRPVSVWGERSRTGAGFVGCCNPVGLTLAGGRGFVTAERGTPSVKLFDPEGRFVRELAGPDRFPENAAASDDAGSNCRSGGLDVAVTPNGAVLVLDRVTARLHRFVV